MVQRGATRTRYNHCRTRLHVTYCSARRRSCAPLNGKSLPLPPTYPTSILLSEAWTGPPAANRGAPGLILRIRPLSTIPLKLIPCGVQFFCCRLPSSAIRAIQRRPDTLINPNDKFPIGLHFCFVVTEHRRVLIAVLSCSLRSDFFHNFSLMIIICYILGKCYGQSRFWTVWFDSYPENFDTRPIYQTTRCHFPENNGPSLRKELGSY